MKKFVFAVLMVMTFGFATGQEVELIRHQVQIGETVKMLSRKYHVTPAEIYKMNKFAVDGISQGMTLQILAPKRNKPAIPKEILQNDPPTTHSSVADNTCFTHTVAPKETLHSISKRYEVPVENIKNANSKKLSKGLQSGMVIVIPAKN